MRLYRQRDILSHFTPTTSELCRHTKTSNHPVDGGSTLNVISWYLYTKLQGATLYNSNFVVATVKNSKLTFVSHRSTKDRKDNSNI